MFSGLKQKISGLAISGLQKKLAMPTSGGMQHSAE
jgi:hypothetical protein